MAHDLYQTSHSTPYPNRVTNSTVVINFDSNINCVKIGTNLS